MNFKNLSKSMRSLKISNASLQISNPILVIVLAISLYFNFQKDTIVINNLNETCQYLELSSSNMSEETHIRFGFFLANLLGNMNPENAPFVKKTILNFIDSSIYQSISKDIDIQIGKINEDELTISYVAERAIYEDGKTFITGKATITGPTGIKRKTIRTYEFDFEVNNYTPTAISIDIYDDVARDSMWRKRQEKRQ